HSPDSCSHAAEGISVPKIPPFLSAAVRFEDPDLRELRTVSPAKWKRVLSNWHVVRMLLLADHSRFDEFPDWVRARLDSYLRDSRERFERIRRAYARMASLLAEAGADHVLIKGISLFPGFADHPRVRPQGDIDLYCPTESVARAREVLLSEG